MHELFVNHLLAFVFGSIWSVYLFTLLSVFIPYTRLWFFFSLSLSSLRPERNALSSYYLCSTN